MRTLSGHRGAVRAIAFLPDGRLASGGKDGRVLLHPAGGGSPEPVDKLLGPAYAVAVRPDGQELAFAGRPEAGALTNEVRLYDPHAGRRTLTLDWPATGDSAALTIWSLSYSADGQQLAAAVRRIGGGNIPDGAGGRCWDLVGGDVYDLFANTYAVRFAPAGGRIALARRLRVEWFDPTGPRGPVWAVPHRVEYAADVAHDPTGGRVAVAVGKFVLLGPFGGKLRKVPTALRTVTTLAGTPDGQTLLAGGSPGGVELLDFNTGARRSAFDPGLGTVHAVAVAPDGLTAAVAADGGLAVIDL